MTFKDIVYKSEMKKQDIIDQAEIPRAYFFKALKRRHKFSDKDIKKLASVMKVSQKLIKDSQEI